MFVEITADPIDHSKIIDKVCSNSAGAINIFMGKTRNVFEGKQVISLTYEAYIPLAEKSLLGIMQRMKDKYEGVEEIAVSHRIGNVPVGETSVVACVSAVHRYEAIHACEELVNELKRETPIWKKEIYSDGKWEWKENCQDCFRK